MMLSTDAQNKANLIVELLHKFPILINFVNEQEETVQQYIKSKMYFEAIKDNNLKILCDDNFLVKFPIKHDETLQTLFTDLNDFLRVIKISRPLAYLGQRRQS